ncbi:MAG: hypothetical protein H7210_03950 [Pyrinomonadaceae bacterium]|nr:hypothetical protein [Phycisphaerales bacterium]
MTANDIGAAKHGRLSVLSTALGALLGVIGSNGSALAQDLFTITAQNRTVTATANGQTISSSAPDFDDWTGSAEVPGALAEQNSGVGQSILQGNVRATAPGIAMATSTMSLTFRTTQPLWYNFVGLNASFNPLFGGGSAALGGGFNVFVGGVIPVSSVGVLHPGTRTFTVSTAQFSNPQGYQGVSYSLRFNVIDVPPVVGGPITRLGTCHRYVQLAQSSWFGAEARAVELGGHLVTINDAGEQAWLQTTFASAGPVNKWIGLRTSTESWVSGQISSYTHWAPNRPTFPYEGEFVYYRATGLWDQSMDNIAGGIVEVDGCRCDWNVDGQRTSDDFFAFLTDFFTAGADFDCSGSTTSTDFFQFLTCFTATACP